MEYRILPHGGEKISVLGMGSSYIGAAGQREIEATFEEAVESGINYFDMASGDAAPFAAYGNVLKALGSRKEVYFQIHFGAIYDQGVYGWTLELEKIKRSVDWQLNSLKTDYIDFGFLHCIDEEKDLLKVLKGGVLDYILELKTQGVVKHLGLSSHTPYVVKKALDMDMLDMLMFSINPAYDYEKGDELGIGHVAERQEMYRAVQAKGVGISVMKPFMGGQLLDARTSPFKRALSEYQCIQYALDKPGVLTVLPGVSNREDLRRILGFLDASADERDYSALGDFAPGAARGVCVYCNHCEPCPAGLDIGLINKYYDLSRAGDELAENHYRNLEKKAGDCVGCGHCDSRCPFGVKQSERMQEIQKYFGG